MCRVLNRLSECVYSYQKMSIHFSASLTEKTPNFKILQSMLYDLRPYNLKELHNSGPIAYTLKLSKRPLISSYIASKLSKK